MTYPLPMEYARARPAFAIFLPSDVLDAAGRPVAEWRSMQWPLQPSDLQTCPYDGPRQGHRYPMNVGALRALNRCRRNFNQTLTKFCQLGLLSAPNASLMNLWRVASIGRSCIGFYTLSSTSAPRHPQAIDSGVASFHKVCRGLHFTYLHIAQAGRELHAEWSPLELLAYAESERLLIGRREVCAAPPSLILAIVDDQMHALQSATGELRVEDEKLRNFVLGVDFVERLALLYEVMRVHIIRRASPSTESRARHCFGMCNDAQEYAKLKAPHLNARLQGMNRLTWPIASAEDLLGSLNEAFERADAVCELPDEESWRCFARTCLTALNIANSFLALACDIQNGSAPKLSLQDMNFFFGPPPFHH